MTRTIRQVEERLRGLQFAGRSYAGLTPEAASGDAARAAAEFEANAAEDLAFVLDRYREVQNAAVVERLVDAAFGARITEEDAGDTPTDEGEQA